MEIITIPDLVWTYFYLCFERKRGSSPAANITYLYISRWSLKHTFQKNLKLLLFFWSIYIMYLLSLHNRRCQYFTFLFVNINLNLFLKNIAYNCFARDILKTFLDYVIEWGRRLKIAFHSVHWIFFLLSNVKYVFFTSMPNLISEMWFQLAWCS